MWKVLLSLRYRYAELKSSKIWGRCGDGIHEHIELDYPEDQQILIPDISKIRQMEDSEVEKSRKSTVSFMP